MTEVRKVSQVVPADVVEAYAAQLGVTIEELASDPFKARYGVSVEELFKNHG